MQGRPDSWYDDMDAMRRDDEYLQAIVARLRRDLSPEAQARLQHIHAYPSRKCSYNIDKERIFLRVRDDGGHLLPECVVRHVLLHEMAHTLNPTQGHDDGFRYWLRWLNQRGRVSSCGDRVPANYNTCH
jgi:hypothetical protein